MSANLNSLLNSAGGEIGLSNRVARFLRSLAQSLVSSGVSSPQYLSVKRISSTQAGVGVGTNLLLNGIIAQRGIPFIAGSGTAVLTPGKTYRLTANGCFNNFSDSVNGFLQVQWVDDDNNTVLVGPGGGDCPKTNHNDARFVGGQSEGPMVDMIWTCPGGATDKQRSVKLRVTSANGTADLPPPFWSATIVEIPG